MLLTGLYPRVLPPVTYGSALQAPECLWDTIRGRTETSRGWEGLSLFIALRWMQDPGWVMVGLGENIQACLRDFKTGTASMARKRHLASIVRGFLCFCLMALMTTGLIRSIRPIRGRKKRDPASGSLMTPKDRVLIELIKESPLVRPGVGS